jgi:transcriptional regulator with XRE-family HTH domain
MKTKPNESIRELRKIIGRTQGEFAAMIGASKDSVASWETGRNRLSPQFARRISLVTGADEKPLLRGKGKLTAEQPFERSKPYTAEEFERHRKNHWGRTDEEAAQGHLEHCADTLELILMAAARPGRGKVKYRLPGVLDSFNQWCERTREDFKLEGQIKEQLEARRFPYTFTCSYGSLREMLREDPSLKGMGFKDDKQKKAEEMMSLELTALPGWCPGRSMKAPTPMITELVGGRGNAERGTRNF